MSITYLGLGSNVGDRERTMLRALSMIGKKFEVLGFSSLYLTEPVGYLDQPSFLNMVVKTDTGETTPEELLCFVKKTEKDLGREKNFRWGPRVIDIDILFIEGLEYSSETLSIPHKEIFSRGFVLVPLSELTDRVRLQKKDKLIAECFEGNPRLRMGVALYKDRQEILTDE